MRDELVYISIIAYNPGSIRSEPMIQTILNVDEEGRMELSNERGDVMIRGLWEQQKDCIVDIIVTNVDATSYLKRDVDSIITSQEKEKNDKYQEACNEQRRDFAPFVVTTNGYLGP